MTTRRDDDRLGSASGAGPAKPITEPRQAALRAVEDATAGQQERTRRLVEREAHEGTSGQAGDDRTRAEHGRAREPGSGNGEGASPKPEA